MKNYLSLFLLLHVIMFVHNIYKIDNLSGFKCYGITKLTSPIRLSKDNQVECFSLDGRKCVDNLNDEVKCREFIKTNIRKLIPFKCKQHLYKENNHLCHQAKLFYFKQWKCFEHTGIKAAVRINRKTGKIKCLSYNGKSCIHGKEALNLCRFRGKLKEISLTCGKNTMRQHRDICQKAFAWFKYSGEWLCKTKTNINTPVRLTITGRIECLSRDGINCAWNAVNDRKCLELIGKYKYTVQCKSKKKCMKKCQKRIFKYKRKPQEKRIRNISKCRKKNCLNFKKPIVYYKPLRKWCQIAYLYIYKNFIDFEGITIRGTPGGHTKSKYKFYWNKFKKYVSVIWIKPKTQYRWRIRYRYFSKVRRQYKIWIRWRNIFKRRFRSLWEIKMRFRRRLKWRHNIRKKWIYILRKMKIGWHRYKKDYNLWKIKVLTNRRFRKNMKSFIRFKNRYRSGFWRRNRLNRKGKNWKWRVDTKRFKQSRYRNRRISKYTIRKKWIIKGKNRKKMKNRNSKRFRYSRQLKRNRRSKRKWSIRNGIKMKRINDEYQDRRLLISTWR